MESSTPHLNYKTQICKHWKQKGFCRLEKCCNFAHGLHELRISDEKASLFQLQLFGAVPLIPHTKKKNHNRWDETMKLLSFSRMCILNVKELLSILADSPNRVKPM